MSSDTGLFAGWEMAAVGCHWSRALPDGRVVHMASWSCGDRSGYSVTLDSEQRVFPDLERATSAFAFLAAAAPGASLALAPGAVDEANL